MVNFKEELWEEAHIDAYDLAVMTGYVIGMCNDKEEECYVKLIRLLNFETRRVQQITTDQYGNKL